LIQALPEAGGGGHDGHPEVPRQPPLVDRQAIAFGLVDQIEADDDPVGDLEHLQHDVQVALEPVRVHHDDRDVGLAEQDEIARNLLVVARREQRIHARQIDQLVAFVRIGEAALGSSDGLAGPVAGVLSGYRRAPRRSPSSPC
jgi:hypothetical protein